MGCSVHAVDIGRVQSPRPVRNDFSLHFVFHPPTGLTHVGLQLRHSLHSNILRDLSGNVESLPTSIP